MNNVLRTLDTDGYALVAGISPAEVARLLDAAESLPPAEPEEVRGGYRDLFTLLPVVRDLAGHPGVRRWPAAVLGPGCFAVRAILFDKTPDATWKVAWHQDLTIPTRQRLERPGFGPWSQKAGIHHVEPPTAILEGMLTVRIHLDPCGSENGPVRVLPGTHRHGKLTAAGIFQWKDRVSPVDTPCAAGALLLMRPLLVHAASAPIRAGHRRVIHLEYTASALPAGLQWREAWGGAAVDAA
jgi:Phytanoyl-CoA dioxygenase (PhyH)